MQETPRDANSNRYSNNSESNSVRRRNYDGNKSAKIGALEGQSEQLDGSRGERKDGNEERVGVEFRDLLPGDATHIRRENLIPSRLVVLNLPQLSHSRRDGDKQVQAATPVAGAEIPSAKATPAFLKTHRMNPNPL